MSEPTLPLVTLARLGLVVVGLGYALFGPGLAMLAGSPFLLDPLVGAGVGPITGGVLGLVVVAGCVGLGVLNLVVAVGLGWRNPWWWAGGVFLGVVYTPTGCLPVGLLLLVALLGSQARRAYGIGQPA